MSTDELLLAVHEAGIVLRAEGGRLKYDAPRGALTADLLDALATHKPALLARLAPTQRYVTLKGGPTLPVEPVLLALDLEARGFRMVPDNGDILITPFSKLTPEDCRQIRRWRQHVLTILNYEAPTCA
jgi:hypothetical protein